MWCIPELDEKYIERMEDILNVLNEPANANEPVVALDERPVLLPSDVRASKPSRLGRVAKLVGPTGPARQPSLIVAALDDRGVVDGRNDGFGSPRSVILSVSPAAKRSKYSDRRFSSSRIPTSMWSR